MPFRSPKLKFRLPKLSLRIPKRKRQPAVQAAKISVQGQSHVEGCIPNQDTAFTLGKPGRPSRLRLGMKRRRVHLKDVGIHAVGVFDGHGPQGEIASILAAYRMADSLERMLTENPGMKLEDAAEQGFLDVAETLNSAECGQHGGTTGSIALIRGNDLVVAHVGDSGIVLVSSEPFQKGGAKYTSVLHRPCEENEAMRIKEYGGTVVQGYVMDASRHHGLAVTRTLGDRDMQECGCISEPHIESFKLKKEDCAVLVGSDGFWDHEGIEVEEVAEMAAGRQGGTARELCWELLDMAHFYGATSDDCTIACLSIN